MGVWMFQLQTVSAIAAESNYFESLRVIFPELASIGGKLPTMRYPTACCGEVH